MFVLVLALHKCGKSGAIRKENNLGARFIFRELFGQIAEYIRLGPSG